ncbi:hypothetical protein OGAPHI_000347 [Ogataea philodendri]|uniref:Peroxisomal membrane protein PEX25 n=1 Tax=Ogataea philodendri TaxID=1378263 RepID=A0A9P8PGI8_9ASCO|nr:uncharacterized protein OGAPHI_000347 [Ogataea philodendri]KAH3671642.1 hypothetical protein OGAPHI_000347 [Ogataea philodendri]
MSTNDELYKEGGALGVYSYYYQSKKDSFSRIRLTSPIRKHSMANGGEHAPPSRLHTPLSFQSGRRLDVMSPRPIGDELFGTHKELVLDDVQPRQAIKPSTVDLWVKVMSLLAGKDKVGKCIQYGLRILILYSIRTRKTQLFNNLKLTQLDFNEKTSSVLAQLVKRPDLLVILFLGQLESKSVGLTKVLSIYRQMLRAGTVPMKVIKLFSRVFDTLSLLQSREKASVKLIKVKEDWFNYKSLGEVMALYYAWFDETLLAFKVGILDEKKMPAYRKFAGKHEAIAWYCTIVLGLRTQFEKLSQLSNKENSLKINYQVKQRAKRLVSTIKPEQSPISFVGSPDLSESMQLAQYSNELKAISEEKYMVQLEVLKLLCDLAYDSVVVFKLKIDEPFHLMFGFGAAFISLSKIWRTEKRKMVQALNQS